MEVRPIDANALIEKLDNINPVDYGAMSSYETHCGARDALSDAVMHINDAPTLSLNTLRDEIYQDAVAHGLWDWAEAYQHLPDLRDSSVDLIRGEVCELEIECGSAERYAEELADVIIVSLSVAGKLGIDIDAAIRRKMEINKRRPWKHGKSNE